MPNDYSWFKAKRTAIADMIKESSKVLDGISLTQYAEGLRQLSSKVDNDTFKIQIVGTFKNGKSTFINALLGEDILPTKAIPCTAVINEIKYGESKRAILNFRNPLPTTLLSDIPEKTLSHMQTYNMQNVPPMDIDPDRISDYVVIPSTGDPKVISATSPYYSVELFYPSNLLKEGVEIIDSPGLNENDERTSVTLEYLDKADAIIFLLDSTHACALDEMDTIENILVPKGFDDMFFVANRIDCVTEGDRAEVKNFIKDKVKSFTSNEVFCVSALNAVEAKTNTNMRNLPLFDFTLFEQRLTIFLTREKGRVKLTKPAKELKHILNTEALYKAIPSQKSQLSTNLTVLKERYENAKPSLQLYEERKESLYNDLKYKREYAEGKIRDAITLQYKKIANCIPAWVDGYTPTTGTGVFGTKAQVEKVKKEIVESVNSKVKKSLKEWNQDVLVPMVESSVKEIFEKSDGTLKGILDGIDELQSQLSGNTNNTNASSGWTRALGVAGICCGFASGASLLTGKFDVTTVAKSLALDLGVGTGLLLLGMTNPIIAIAGVVAVIANAIAGGQKALLQDIKSKISSAMRESIINEVDAKSSEIVLKIDKEFQKSIDTAIKSIDMKISDLKAQIEAVLNEKEKGEASAQKRLIILNDSESKLQIICKNLDDFVFDLAENG